MRVRPRFIDTLKPSPPSSMTLRSLRQLFPASTTTSVTPFPCASTLTPNHPPSLSLRSSRRATPHAQRGRAQRIDSASIRQQTRSSQRHERRRNDRQTRPARTKTETMVRTPAAYHNNAHTAHSLFHSRRHHPFLRCTKCRFPLTTSTLCPLSLS